MSTLDIGIDLGTTMVVIYVAGLGIVLKEPTVVALDRYTNEIVSIGAEAHKMLGKTPDRINVVRPLMDGVISDYEITERMVKYFLKKVCPSNIVRPRVTVCVPSGITNVESRAVVDAAVSAGARKVFLIEEPVAAAIGAGVDISKPDGNLIIDVGGGTTDVAVLSLNGIACKTSIKVAGNHFDREIIKHIRSSHSVLIGDNMAEKIKVGIASVLFSDEELSMDAKGNNLLTGLPVKITVTRSEIYPSIVDLAEQIAMSVQQVMERTLPELVGDVHVNGAIMTGGGALLHGLDRYIENKTGIRTRVAENPIECVSIGTGRSFESLDKLLDGFVDHSTHTH